MSKLLKLLFLIFLQILLTYSQPPEYIPSEETFIEEGLDFIDYFYPRNTVNTNKFYTGFIEKQLKLMSKSNSNKFFLNSVFNQISNMVYSTSSDSFFLCPIDNKMIWEFPGDLSSAKSQMNFDTDGVVSITGLRCTVDIDESFFFIAYIGHNVIYTLQFKIKSFTIFHTFEEGDKILEFASPDDRKETQTFYVLLKNSDKDYINLISLQYPDFSTLFKYSYYLDEMPLYNNIKLSLDYFKQQIIIFSYDQNNFNYYIIDHRTGLILNYSNNKIFNLDNVIFQEVVFNKMNDLFLYRMNQDGKDYYGVGDIIMNKIIFNRNESVNSIRNYEEVNLLDRNNINKSILIAKDQRFVQITCPFLKDNRDCQTECKCLNNGGITTPSGYKCVDCKALGKKFYIRYCLDDCPIGLFPDSNNICIKCVSPNSYYNKDTRNCVSKCPDYNSFDSFKVCYKCLNENKFYLRSKNSCVINCPTNWISDTLTGECINCKASNKFYCNDPHQCCNECPFKYGADINNVCYRCKSQNKYYVIQRKTCESACINSKYDNDNYTCDICKERTPSQFYLPAVNECLAICPEFHLYTSDNICYNCKSLNKFWFNNSCVDKCPDGSQIDSDNICTVCKSLNKFLFNNECIDSCPVNYLYDSNNLCYSCKSLNKFRYINSCVDKCPNGSQIDSENICTVCKSLGKFLFNNECIDSCPINNLYDIDQICYTCNDKFNKFYDTHLKQCVDTCQEGSSINTISKICTPCQHLGRFLYNNECTNKCPNYSIILTNNICYSCKDNNKFYVDPDNKCVDKCDNFMKSDITNKICTNCKSTLKFLLNNECIDKCPQYYLFDSNNICYNCKLDQNGKFLNDNKCVDKCPEGSKIDSLNNVCSYCGSNNQFYLTETDQCVDKCPDGYLVNNSKRCYTCKEINQFFYRDQCINECPLHCAIDSEKNVCNCCIDKGLFYNSNKCLDKCPLDIDPSMIIIPNNVCYSCKENGKYLMNNSCTSSCPDHSAIDQDQKTCEDCLENGKFLYPKMRSKCLEKCPDNSKILDKNICQVCKEDLNQFFFDRNNKDKNNCITTCPNYSTVDNINKVCKSCMDFNMYYITHENKCESECKFCKFENNICNFCNECHSIGKIKFDNVCVDKCPIGSVLNDKNECILCTNTNEKFYLNNKCIMKCPQQYYYKDDKVCLACDKFVYNYVCIDICPYTTGILPNHDITCKNCRELNLFNFDNNCVIKCPDETNIDNINKVCVRNLTLNKCEDTCNMRGKCDQKYNKCICDFGFTGDFCEIKIEKNLINIVATTKILKSFVNSFSFQFDKDFTPPNKFSILWDVNTIKDQKFYMNGRTEMNLKIKENGLKEGINIITLTIINQDKGMVNSIMNSIGNNIYKSSIEININSLQVERFSLNVKYYRDEEIVQYGVSMKTLVEIQILDKNINTDKRMLISDQNKFMYKFYYLDSFGQELALTDLFISSNIFMSKIPITSKIIIEVMDNRGQTVKLNYPIEIRKDEKYDTPLEDILNGNSNLKTPTQQLIDLQDFLSHKTETLTEEKVQKVSDFLQNSFNQILNNSNSTMSHSSILAVFNQVVINQSSNKDNSENKNAINNLNSLLNKFTSNINSMNNSNMINKDDLKSYYRSMDFVFDAFNNNNNNNNSTVNSTNSSTQLQTVQSSISNINQYLSRGMEVNERVVISTKNFDSYIERPGSSQKSIEFQEENKDHKTFKDYKDYQMDNTDKKDSCDSTTYLCVNGDNFNHFKKHLNATVNKYNDIAIFAVNINNRNLYKNTNEEYQPLSTTSFQLSMYDTNSNSSLTKTNFLTYDVMLKIPNNTNSNRTSNSACISINKINKQTVPTCMTYYNYTSNRSICRCTGTGEIVNIYNYALSNIAKLFQFPKWSLDLINPLSTCLVLGSLTIVVFFSIFLLFFDYYDDKNFLSSNILNDHQVINNEFKDITALCNANIFQFALYITMYIYPFFSVFSIYNYNQPRFLRFSVEILSILMTMSFSLLPYYKVPFNDAQIFMDKRDIEESNWSIDSLPYKLGDIISTVLYSIFASICIGMIIYFFSVMMRWKQLMFDVWKYRKTIINQYVRQYLIRPISLPEKWKMLRMRILAFNRICGEYMNRKKMKGFEEKYGREKFNIDNSNNLNKRLISDPRDVMLELKDLSKQSKYNHYSKSLYDNDTIYEDKTLFYLTKADSFCLDSSENNKKQNKICNNIFNILVQKIKNINKLYFKKKNPIITSNSSFIIYTNLKMYRLFQFSYFNIIPNRIVMAKLREEKCNIFKSIIVAISLIGFYIFFYTILIMLIFDIYERYRYYIIKVWLLPSLMQLVFVRFIMNYNLNLIKSFLLFKFYRIRKTKWIIRILFKVFITKELVYMHKIRNFITKYEKELNEVNRSEKEKLI